MITKYYLVASIWRLFYLLKTKMLKKTKVFTPDRSDFIKELREILGEIQFVGDSGVTKKAKIEELLVKLS